MKKSYIQGTKYKINVFFVRIQTAEWSTQVGNSSKIILKNFNANGDDVLIRNKYILV